MLLTPLRPLSFSLALLQPAGKGSFLLHTWATQAQTVRANGFSPATEAVGDGAFKMKDLAETLPKLKTQAGIIGLCEKGQMSFETLEEPHKSMGKRLSRTKLMAAISAGAGSAVAFVSDWEDHVSIDYVAVNPSYMGLSEKAEEALLENVVSAALADGVSDVRLNPSYQVEGDAFYERLGFYADADAEGAKRLLRYRDEAATTADAATPAEATSAADGKAWPMLGGSNKPGTYKVRSAARTAWEPPEGWVPNKMPVAAPQIDPAVTAAAAEAAAASALPFMSPAEALTFLTGAATRTSLLAAGVSIDTINEATAIVRAAVPTPAPKGGASSALDDLWGESVEQSFGVPPDGFEWGELY